MEIEFPSAAVGSSKDRGHFIDRAAFDRFAAAYAEAVAVLPPAVASTVTTAAGPVRAYDFTTGRPTGAGRAPILLLAGRDSSTPMWAPVLPALLGLGREVHAVDSVGGPGCSAQTGPLDTAEQQAGWVAEVVRGLGHERAHLVGHSLGGWLAVHVAMHRPDVVASVTAVDPPRVYTELRLGFVAAGLTASVRAVPAGLRRRLVGWIAGGSMDDDDPVDRLGWASLQAFRARQAPPRLPSARDLAAIDAPVLALLAGRSSVQRAERAARGARAAGAEVDLWPDAGHCLYAEQPARFVTRLADFLDGTGS